MKKITILVLTIIVCAVFNQNLNGGVKRESKMGSSISSKEINCNDKGTNKCEILKKHPFSRQDRNDTFKLIYNCENLEDTMSLQIVSFSGTLIYEHRFLGGSFYDYGRPWYVYVTDPKRGKNFDDKKLSSQVADSLKRADILYIKKRISDFFNEDKFIADPIVKLNKEHLDESHFEGIEGDSTAIGFRFQLLVEGFEMIAYSKKKQKVQLIASSD